jgi:hypothetical protein
MTPVAPVSAELLIPANADQGARPIPWAETRSRLADASTYWLATVHRDGRPQQRPVLVVVFGFGTEDDRYRPRSTRWEFAASARLGAGS